MKRFLSALFATGLAAGCAQTQHWPMNTTIGNTRCSLSEKELGRRLHKMAPLFGEEVREIRELPDGYAFRFEADDALTVRLFEFVHLERQCCGFLTFELTLEPKPGPVWLRLRGGADAKQFIREMLDQIGVAVPTNG